MVREASDYLGAIVSRPIEAAINMIRLACTHLHRSVNFT